MTKRRVPAGVFAYASAALLDKKLIEQAKRDGIDTTYWRSNSKMLGAQFELTVMREVRANPPLHMDMRIVTGGMIRNRLSPADIAARARQDRDRAKRGRRRGMRRTR